MVHDLRWKVAGVACLAAIPLLVASCGDIVGGGASGRTYVMGFTGYPHANSSEAVIDAWDVIARDADLAVIHEDGGIPWQEALDGTPYPTSYAAWHDFQVSSIPAGHTVYLAVTPISNDRTSLAGYRSDGVNEPLPYPWNTYSFDDQEVIDAFTNHCLTMIDVFDPDYFAYAIEANLLAYFSPELWDEFLTLAEHVFEAVKDEHPFLPVFVTIHADIYHSNQASQIVPVTNLLEQSDAVAVSAYPFGHPLEDPADLDPGYFTDIADLAPGKIFGIAETCWPAEPIDFPYPVYIAASEATQQAYVERLLADCDELYASFVCWFLTRDYDDYWESDFQYDPGAATIRFWRDCGLYDGAGYARPALASWLDVLDGFE
ncbi:hypothetical protein K8S17_07070 [bacterium]|nr:hypothetical protein [bacterium]